MLAFSENNFHICFNKMKVQILNNNWWWLNENS